MAEKKIIQIIREEFHRLHKDGYTSSIILLNTVAERRLFTDESISKSTFIDSSLDIGYTILDTVVLDKDYNYLLNKHGYLLLKQY